MGTTTTANQRADSPQSKRDISSIQNTTTLWTGDGADGNSITEYTMNTGTNAGDKGDMSTHMQSYGSANSTTYGYWCASAGIFEYQMAATSTVIEKGDTAVSASSLPASGQGSP